jgi:hypothetical protein
MAWLEYLRLCVLYMIYSDLLCLPPACPSSFIPQQLRPVISLNSPRHFVEPVQAGIENVRRIMRLPSNKQILAGISPRMLLLS